MKKPILLFAAALSALTLAAQSPRMILLEEFTGENCGPCAAANPALNALLAQTINQGRVAAIKWEVPIPSAPTKTWSLYKTNQAEIDWRYRPTNFGGYGYPSQSTPTSTNNSGTGGGINSAPQIRIDGQYQWQFGASGNHPNNLSNPVLANAASISAPFTINMAREWASGGSVINVTVNIQASMNFTAVGALKFRTVMVERHVEFATPPGSTSEKEFHDVAIKSFPNIQNGTPLAAAWTSGQTYSFTLSCPIPAYARKKTEIAFVGFIQDDGDRMVHQAYRLEKEALPFDAAAVSAAVPAVCTGSMAPTVIVQNTGQNAITNVTITPYINGTAANITQWTGNIAVNGTAAIVLDPITTSAGTGVNTFSYNVTAINGGDLDPLNNGNSAKFIVVNNYQGTPVAEGFAGTFPPSQWSVIGDKDGLAWDKVTTAGAYGLSSESTRLRLFSTPKTGDVQELILPPIDLSGADAPLLDFVYAYAMKTSTSNDKLEVMISTDCGANWTTVYSKSGSALNTAFGLKASTWVPTGPEWLGESLSLVGYNQPEVLVKFVGTHGDGNNLYLDDINLHQPTVTGLNKAAQRTMHMAAFPNPSEGTLSLSVSSPSVADAEIMITNTLGQVVRIQKIRLAEGTNTVFLDMSSEASGVYNANVKSGARTANTKFSITH